MGSLRLITSRRVIFTPSTDIKEELARTAISITCYDRNGDVVKRVTSTDDGIVEDPDDSSNTQDPSGGGSGTDSGSSGGSGDDIPGYE